LADIKNPPPLAYIKQANIAHNQQVNNRAENSVPESENENPQNELLTVKHGEALDSFGRAQQAELIRRWKPWEQSTGPRTLRVRQRLPATPIWGVCGTCCGNYHRR
jgi:hypothetical protein